MVKSWLVKSEAPFMGTEQCYAAYAESEDKLLDWLYENWWDEECLNLYDSFGYKWEDDYDEEFREQEEYEDFDAFVEAKYEEWCQECTMSIEECDEEDFKDYVPGGKGELEIIYDERNGN